MSVFIGGSDNAITIITHRKIDFRTSEKDFIFCRNRIPFHQF